MAKQQIAIIGAGIGGLTLAALLERAGFAPLIFEQAAKFARVGAGIQLSPNPMKVMREIGLEPLLRQRGYDPEIFRSRQWDTGEVTNAFPKRGVCDAKYGAPYLMFHRGDVHDALAGIVPTSIIRFGRKLTGIDPSGPRVKLSFADGSTETVDAVVGADGVHSVVREKVVGPDKPRYTGRVGYRATFPVALLKGAEIDENTKWWGPDRHLVHYYTNPRQDEIYFVTATPDADFTIESWSSKGDLKELRAAYEGFHPKVQAILNACPEVHKWALVHHAPLPRWGEGRVVLLGDAAHTMPPWMAQGAAMAIEDAAVLTRCLAASQGEDIEGAFRRFEATRRGRTSAIQTKSVSNTFNRESGEDTDWVYGYDALQVPLAQATELDAARAA